MYSHHCRKAAQSFSIVIIRHCFRYFICKFPDRKGRLRLLLTRRNRRLAIIGLKMVAAKLRMIAPIHHDFGEKRGEITASIFHMPCDSAPRLPSRKLTEGLPHHSSSHSDRQPATRRHPPYQGVARHIPRPPYRPSNGLRAANSHSCNEK